MRENLKKLIRETTEVFGRFGVVFGGEYDLRQKNLHKRFGELLRTVIDKATGLADREFVAAHRLVTTYVLRNAEGVLSDDACTFRDKGPMDAGGLYRLLALESQSQGNKREAAEYSILATESYRKSTVPLRDWQVEDCYIGPGVAGSLYRLLALEAESKCNKREAAEYWILAAESYRKSTVPLTDWQVEARDIGPGVAGGLYRLLALESQSQGNKREAAQYSILATESYRKSTVPLRDWQVEDSDIGPGVAGSLYRLLAVESESKGNKREAAEYWILATESYRKSTVPLTDWQVRELSQARQRVLGLLEDWTVEVSLAVS
jgi:predicted phosphoadenosine phosphosulfate sulfurtransferase